QRRSSRRTLNSRAGVNCRTLNSRAGATPQPPPRGGSPPARVGAAPSAPSDRLLAEVPVEAPEVRERVRVAVAVDQRSPADVVDRVDLVVDRDDVKGASVGRGELIEVAVASHRDLLDEFGEELLRLDD